MSFYIAVVGGSTCTEEERKLARQVGLEAARKGAVTICGGGGGVMESAAEGAREANGTVIGILPGNSSREGNPHLSFAIATGLGEARNAIIARAADAVIAVGGEYGTLSEIALAIKMEKPVIGLKSWRLEPPQKLSKTMLNAESAAEAVEMAFSAAR
jgi:uncharacterized protein (TIGR00725 family)